MDAVENFMRILRFDHPERVISKIPVHVIRYTGNMHEDYDSSGGDTSPVGTSWKDIWGTHWKKVREDVMGMPVGFPLAEVNSLLNYPWPDANDERICGKIDRMAREFPDGDLLLGGSHRDTLWEKAYMLVGMETLMMYFYSEPAFVKEVLQRIINFQLGIAEHYLKLGVRVAFLGDDLGSQVGPLLSPPMVREFLLPEYKRLCQLYKQHGVLIRFHSCGNIEAFLELFMELGVDVLNPVQATANNLEKVRVCTQGRMALHGGISSRLLMEGPVEQIELETRRMIWKMGREGGYICAPDQDMPYPPGNRCAFDATVDQYGTYPLEPYEN